MTCREGSLAVCQDAGAGGSVGVELWVEWRCCVGLRREKEGMHVVVCCGCCVHVHFSFSFSIT